MVFVNDDSCELVALPIVDSGWRHQLGACPVDLGERRGDEHGGVGGDHRRPARRLGDTPRCEISIAEQHRWACANQHSNTVSDEWPKSEPDLSVVRLVHMDTTEDRHERLQHLGWVTRPHDRPGPKLDLRHRDRRAAARRVAWVAQTNAEGRPNLLG